MGDRVKMLPPPVAHSEGSAWGSRRGRCGCLACGAVVVLWNVCVVSASLLLLVAVFAVVLLPAALLLYAGFLCHSRVSRRVWLQYGDKLKKRTELTSKNQTKAFLLELQTVRSDYLCSNFLCRKSSHTIVFTPSLVLVLPQLMHCNMLIISITLHSASSCHEMLPREVFPCDATLVLCWFSY